MKKADVVGKEKSWFYSDAVKDHFFNPRNIFKTKEEAQNYKADGVGVIGSPVCGDVMKIWIKVDAKTDRIKECKYQTFGCASAIASTSMLSVMAAEKRGMKLDDAMKLTPKDIMQRLGGLPARKIHCSVLGDKALREAINDYFKKTKQFHRVKEDETKIIDTALKITNKDIEEAVLEGAKTFEDVQKRTKVGVQDKNCIPEVKKLIEFYRKKHFEGSE
ncbi:MAG: iron-sulfur cluster assembly scaffold protein [Candidatus Diapherotrites archaeon]|nr:iron-sulfur cluster assembly scaffold protein [Candidatus Diapherotrites archaeon]